MAIGYHLRRRGRGFVILDQGAEVGASWRKRWDSLRLFTPAGFSHLPGMAFPAGPAESPTKDAMADYLATYAQRFALPVELSTTVVAVDRAGTDLLVTASDGRSWRARNVVVATSALGRPQVPEFAGDLDPAVVQLRSSTYRRPRQLPTGPVLVVGAGNSGAEIAVDLASPERVVWLAGRNVGHVPPLGTWTYPLMRVLDGPGAPWHDGACGAARNPWAASDPVTCRRSAFDGCRGRSVPATASRCSTTTRRFPWARWSGAPGFAPTIASFGYRCVTVRAG